MRLNIATRHSRGDVDAPWLALLESSVSRTDYLNQLVRTFGFIAPFESACRYTPQLDGIRELARATRAGLIAQDLLSLGLDPKQVASVPQCMAITTFRSVPEALGWTYVVERTTLLQANIRRHLLAKQPELAHAFAYLSTFDGRLGEHWRVFGRLLDRVGAMAERA